MAAAEIRRVRKSVNFRYDGRNGNENIKGENMFPPFPEKRAAQASEEIARKIDSGEIGVIRVTKESEERKDAGMMIGALVCRDEDGNETVIASNSGTARRLDLRGTEILSLPSQYAEPVASAEEIARALSGNDAEIHRLTEEIGSEKNAEKRRGLESKRKILCAQSLANVHALYSFCCADGKTRTLRDICESHNAAMMMPEGKLPPTGTGDCCAPKLLHHAFKNNLLPVSMCEFFVGNGGTKKCEPCDERCGILLPAMLGLKILFRDDDICAIDKPSGLLSVPGRTEKDSAETRFRRLFPGSPAQPAVHRLDMETSGILILALNRESQRAMQRQFENGDVRKEYVALLDGVLAKKGIPAHGTVETFFRLDVENRPHQIWDAENGKKAVTEWQILGVERYESPDKTIQNATRVLFMPHTGRTHQLRTASADAHGFGIPIIGDSLYGTKADGERLMLHARRIEFTHPRTGVRMTIECGEAF